MTFYAKSEGKETIREHTDRLLHNLKLLKNAYGHKLMLMDERMWKLLEIAVQYHDVGKVNTVFQNKIRQAIRESVLETDMETNVPHNYLSVGCIPLKQLDLTKEEERLLIHAVGYHHERDQHPEKEIIRHVLENDIKNQLSQLSEHMNLPITEKFSYRFVDRLLNRYTYHDGEEFWKYVMIKGLLHRLDHAASAHIDVERDVEKSIYINLNEYMHKQGFRKNDLQQFAEQHHDKHVIAIAQTGMGKTEAALLWIREDKAFFTLPLRVSINAIYDRIKEKMGYDAVGLLHSTSVHYLVDKEENWEELKQQSEHYAKKLLLTTIDQILKFPFYYKGFEKELAAMANAKVVIDEIQAYEPRIASMLIKALEMIHRVGGKFMIMTATLPTLYLEELKQRNVIDDDQIAIEEFIDTSVHRHRICLRAEGIEEAIGEILNLGETSQILVIVNTVRKAMSLYDKFLQCETHVPVYLLHSQFTQEDRQLLEKRIKEFNENNEKGIWITTQLVEASIDIDFDYLFTEMSTLDSLFQRFGRCYRKRALDHDGCNIHIFTENISGVPKVYNEHLVNESIRQLEPYDNQIIDERAKVEMVAQLYDRKRLTGTSFLKEFEDALYMFDNLDPYGMDKREAQQKLRDIQNIQVITRKIYDQIDHLFEQYKKEKEWKKRLKLRMEIEKKTVSVQRYVAEKYVSERLPKPFDHIYIADVEYDFNREQWKGKGILLDKPSSNFS
ncbi:CRISPR-associated endonuclease/helicase Cas3 [Anoxybacillus voinovskiensis]|uniref:CRISPR-associated endonuclease/helicase Cas3 n=1 Tax=Anoxybacteroides voinovskiense TaxID=230470 RepID=A0A840DK48_9BACL|nr:CRISPR-associated helicase Cas3' [Anoxybacillus voinovskiensis]MBB4073671.1 CRISPR-associated endonuclease/helicase Cas3 [Anoxybacillus voinovskiensis]GGJ63656.1 CRISPR-associated helicase/endonuclease Cas3 [Anoxybacillus voinovskiensis]